MIQRYHKLLAGAAVALGLAPGMAFAADNFQAVITEGQQVSPTGSSATGSAVLTLNDAEDALAISIHINGLDLDGNQTANPDDDVTGMHIHAAPAGVNGGVVFGFISPGSDLDDLAVDPVAGTVTSVWDGAEGNGTTLAAQLNDLRNSGLYINIHTSAYPGGEIRGQITPLLANQNIPTLRWVGLVTLAVGLILVAGLYLRRRSG